jgi:hypothetical protein
MLISRILDSDYDISNKNLAKAGNLAKFLQLPTKNHPAIANAYHHKQYIRNPDNLP